MTKVIDFVTKVIDFVVKVIKPMYDGYVKILNKMIEEKNKKYISVISASLSLSTIIFFLLIISQIYNILSIKDDTASDSISFDYLVNNIGQETDEIIENYKITIPQGDGIPQEDSVPQGDEVLDLNYYKDSFNDYVIISIDDLSNFSENKYLDYDIVKFVNEILNDYFKNVFKFQNFSAEEIESLNNELFKNPKICGIYREIQTLKPNFDENHHKLYGEEKSEHSFDCNKNSIYVDYLFKFEELIGQKEILPYAAYQYAFAANCYSTILNRQYERVLSIGITTDEIIAKSLDTVYLFLYDLSFNSYEMPNGEMHDTNFSYYSIGMTYYGLAMNMEDDFDKAKYLAMAIYFFDNSYTEDNEEHNPKYQIEQCYQDLSKIELLKNYRDTYINKCSY